MIQSKENEINELINDNKELKKELNTYKYADKTINEFKKKNSLLRDTINRLNEKIEELTKKMEQNRNEEEMAGYRDVLNTIHENYEFIDINSNIILQLHRDLYTYAPSGGNFKNADNVIAETDSDGNQSARFIPVPAFQTPEFMNNLCKEFSEVFKKYIQKSLR